MLTRATQSALPRCRQFPTRGVSAGVHQASKKNHSFCWRSKEPGQKTSPCRKPKETSQRPPKSRLGILEHILKYLRDFLGALRAPDFWYIPPGNFLGPQPQTPAEGIINDEGTGGWGVPGAEMVIRSSGHANKFQPKVGHGTPNSCE